MKWRALQTGISSSHVLIRVVDDEPSENQTTGYTKNHFRLSVVIISTGGSQIQVQKEGFKKKGKFGHALCVPKRLLSF